jgi:cytochrome c-type biogenesis protein CcmF
MWSSPERLATGKKAIIQVFYNPLTMWVWMGGILLVIGTLIALLPNRKTPARKRPLTESPEAKSEVETNTREANVS